MLNMNISDINGYQDTLIDIEVSISSEQAQSFIELYLKTHGFPNVKASDIIPVFDVSYDYEDCTSTFNGFKFNVKMKLKDVK